MSTQLLVSIAVFALLLFWAVGAYNRLVRLKNAIASAFVQIDVQLKRRYDLISNLVEAAKTYLHLERETLDAVLTMLKQARGASDSARSRPTHGTALKTLALAEKMLDASLAALFTLAQAYPEFKDDATIRASRDELSGTENQLEFARQTYNEAVLGFNNAQAQFPALLLARLFAFTPAAQWQGRSDAADSPAAKIQA